MSGLVSRPTCITKTGNLGRFHDPVCYDPGWQDSEAYDLLDEGNRWGG
jgi:hypothetical protein